MKDKYTNITSEAYIEVTVLSNEMKVDNFSNQSNVNTWLSDSSESVQSFQASSHFPII